MKDKNRIINEMVVNTADVMEAKAEELEIIAQQFDEKGDPDQAENLRKYVPQITQAIALMRERAGCWA